ncbi:MAG: hypothetical protein AAF152_05295, partial [Cyanobacteria bacterium P01_A01_bin.114]
GTNRMIPNFINNYIETSDPRFTETIIREFQNSTTDHILNDAQTGYFSTNIYTGEAMGRRMQRLCMSGVGALHATPLRRRL